MLGTTALIALIIVLLFTAPETEISIVKGKNVVVITDIRELAKDNVAQNRRKGIISKLYHVFENHVRKTSIFNPYNRFKLIVTGANKDSLEFNKLIDKMYVNMSFIIFGCSM